ncbi:WD repeat-containing protein 18-like [Clavelina lepadiformis]|uniref:WD repeat-containing protein 18-like n=1 Tax=Clavelina lepadiformis TaxID=159417 RepID=UPI004042F1C7
MEVLFVTDDSGKPYNINAVNLKTGETISHFKGGASSSKTLCQIKQEVLISALPKKAVLNVFEMNRRVQQPLKVAVPGVPNYLTSSPSGDYLAAAIGEKVFLWDVTDGDLLAILFRHYLDVTSLSFTSDSGFLISSGKDGMVAVWDVADMINTDHVQQKQPFLCWTGHSLAVNCITCSTAGFGNSRIYTGSSDKTVKIYDIFLGSMLRSLVFDFEATAMCVDHAESMLFVGGANGCIGLFNLATSPEKHHDIMATSVNESYQESKGIDYFNAHSGSVSSLVCNCDASVIVSGSADCTVKIWNANMQYTKVLHFEGPVSNLLLTIPSSTLSSATSKSWFAFPKLSHAMSVNKSDEKSVQRCRLNAKFVASKQSTVCTKPFSPVILKNISRKQFSAVDDSRNKLQQLSNQVHVLQKENENLYNFVMEKVLPK